MTEQPTEDISDARLWTWATEFDDFVRLCGCSQPHLSLVTDPDSFSMTQRGGRMGPVSLSEWVVGADTSLQCGEGCGAYRVFLVRSGRAEWVHRGVSVGGVAGTAAVYAPVGLAALRWHADTQILLLKIDRSAVEDALSDALGRQVAAQPDFAPLMPMNTAPARSWINMLALFAEQFFHPNGLLNQPLVGMPFVDSLVRGLLFAAEHSHRGAITGDERPAVPRAIRIAVDIMEAEADLPLTLSAIAARSQVSVRSLQLAFKRHLGLSPMAYLREVRLRRAHQNLLESDPSMVTVASVAFRWGFTNLGRFAAAHAARYREPPVEALHRSA
ncbi:MAG TPA: AraC family transcriptional regulator [Mycobacterium sp.]|uniref:AraC family transcriptional regulator n=1 Tax=Mycobacterium sp. TaxID=1785 RepID=UPI002F42A668